MEKSNRNYTIIIYNLAGIVMNVGLAVVKFIVGIAVHSHAIMLDGVNGISDSLSLALTILSATIGNKKADEKHPMGYGRIEYISSFLITAIIIYVGVKAIISSVKVLINPHEPPLYNTAAILIMLLSMVLKVVYGVVMRRKGREINSSAMYMTGTDSLGDSLVSAGILFGILVVKFTHFNIENYICILISLILIYTGARLLKDSMDKMLGTRTDPEIKKNIVRTLMDEEEILNVSNMTVHNYGENVYIGSLDIQVPSDMRADEIASLSRRVISIVGDCGVQITSVGINAADMHDPEVAKIWDEVIKTAMRYKSVTRINSLNVDEENKSISFFVVQDYSYHDRDQEKAELEEELRRTFSDMTVEIYSTVDL
jgi:cation diffusion facilitator family transporter